MTWLGDMIKGRRAVRNMSLQDVADEARLTKAHVWEMETGRAANPCVSTLVGLSVALDMPPDVLFLAAAADFAVKSGGTVETLPAFRPCPVPTSDWRDHPEAP